MNFSRVPIVLVVGACLFSTGCTEKNEVEPVTVTGRLYRVEVGDDFRTADSKNWIMISSSDGEWLAVRPFESGEAVELDGTVPLDNLVNIHFLSVTSPNGQSYFQIRSFTNLSVGGTWKLQGAKTVTGENPALGTVIINIKNYSGSIFSPMETIKVSSVEGNVVKSMTRSGSDVTIVANLFKRPSELVLSSFKGSSPFYYTLKNIEPGAIVEVDYFAFKHLEHTYAFSYETTFYYHGFYGFYNTDDFAKTGYILSEFIDYDGGSIALNLGYTKSYDKYRTIISYGQGPISRTYYKFGEPLTYYPSFAYTWQPTFSGTLSDFSCSPRVPLNQALLTFNNSQAKNLNWEIVVPSKEGIFDLRIKLDEFPDELTRKYPSLKLNDIAFAGGGFTKYVDSYTWEDFIKYQSDPANNSALASSNEYYHHGWTPN